jgi:hypothetical protein
MRMYYVWDNNCQFFARDLYSHIRKDTGPHFLHLLEFEICVMLIIRGRLLHRRQSPFALTGIGLVSVLVSKYLAAICTLLCLMLLLSKWNNYAVVS